MGLHNWYMYVLQTYGLREIDSKEIERLIFGFIWKSYKCERNRGIDRIKRYVLENKYEERGLYVQTLIV